MRSLRSRRLSLLAIALLAACSEAAPTDPLAPTGDEDPLTVVMPDLVPEAGTAGTDRYVPVLQRILHRSVAQIREKLGDEAVAAGRDVSRIAQGAQTAGRELVASRDAAEAGRLVQALVLAARALDLVTRLHAAL